MPLQIFVGLCGYKQSGKDTVYSLLRTNFPSINVIRLAFADELKNEICQKLGITREALEVNKKYFRIMLQEYGQEQKEKRGEKVWIEALEKKVSLDSSLQGATQLFIITDLRFPMEACWIRERRGYIIKIERFDKTEDTHPSETSVDQVRNVDYFLPNKGTLRDLERETKWASEEIKTKYKLPS